ncbi:MAG: hypothetical protein B5M53_01255 [Candidatus Cloacimonas sp. 4484_209]|nr:MAG: hypothetical protein B5M53_01255 [Candidatus Cloacimonas sp. 4484_209]
MIRIFVVIGLFFFTGLFGGEYNPTTLVIPPFQHTFGYNKVTLSALKMVVGNTIKFNNPQGIAAVKLKALDDKSTSEDDDELTVFAVNSGANEIFYNKGFKGAATFGGFGSGEGQFWQPMGICANPDGDVWVADKRNDRIVKLFCDGMNLKFVRNVGEYGLFNGEFDGPTDVAMDPKGKVYVTDTGNDRIQVFSPDGNFLYAFSGTNDFRLHSPTAIDVIGKNDRWSFWGKPFIVVVDDNRTRLTQFSMKGKPLATQSTYGLQLDGAQFGYVAIDYYSNIYVTDEANSQIDMFDRELKFVTTFGREGTDKAEFYHPRGIAIWKKYGQVFILEESDAQYYWMGVDAYIKGVFPAIFTAERPGATISLFITQPAHITVNIYSKDTGKLVRTLIPKYKRDVGEENIVWDGLDSYGKLVSPGKYEIKIILTPTYSSEGNFSKEITCYAERQ